MAKQLVGVAEADAVVLLDELNGITGGAAAHAMVETFGGRDDEVGVVFVIVEGTQADEVTVAVFVQLDAA